MGLFRSTVNALRSGLSRTRSALATPLAAMRGRTIDNDSINELERLLLSSDVGPTTTDIIVSELRDAISKGEKQNRDILFEINSCNGSLERIGRLPLLIHIQL